jgi:hypothetical protein
VAIRCSLVAISPFAIRYSPFFKSSPQPQRQAQPTIAATLLLGSRDDRRVVGRISPRQIWAVSASGSSVPSTSAQVSGERFAKVLLGQSARLV